MTQLTLLTLLIFLRDMIGVIASPPPESFPHTKQSSLITQLQGKRLYSRFQSFIICLRELRVGDGFGLESFGVGSVYQKNQGGGVFALIDHVCQFPDGSRLGVTRLGIRLEWR